MFSRVVEVSRKAGANILADGKKRVKAEDVHVETLLKGGHTVREILKLLEKANLICYRC